MQVRNQGNYTLMWKKTRVKQESNVRQKIPNNLIMMIITIKKIQGERIFAHPNGEHVESDKR